MVRTVLKEARLSLEKTVSEGRDININLAIDQNRITRDLKYALATGNWSANRRGNVKTGVSQVLHRLTFMSTLSHLRRLSTAIARDGKIAKPRQLHNTHWGMVCLAAGTAVTVGCGLSRPIEQLRHAGQSVLSFDERAGTLESDVLTLGATGANNKGMKRVLRLTLADGRQLFCTPDHLVQTRSRGWVQARDLVYGQTHSINDIRGSAPLDPGARENVPIPARYDAQQLADELIIGPDAVVDSLEEDRVADSRWTLPIRAGLKSLSWASEAARERSLAFARLLGAMLTDGNCARSAAASQSASTWTWRRCRRTFSSCAARPVRRSGRPTARATQTTTSSTRRRRIAFHFLPLCALPWRTFSAWSWGGAVA